MIPVLHVKTKDDKERVSEWRSNVEPKTEESWCLKMKMRNKPGTENWKWDIIAKILNYDVKAGS